MSKQMWRYQAFEDNTEAIEEYCAKHNLAIQYLNNGYQLRIEGVLDIYPVRMKYHYISTNQRGEIDTLDGLEDIVKSLKSELISNIGGVLQYPKRDGVVAIGHQPNELNILKPRKQRRWWMFWRKR